MTKDASPSERWEQLPQEKRALLEARLKRAAEGPSGGDRIGRRPDPGSAPLSYAQERLWFLDRLEPGSGTYNRSWGLRLTGHLDPSALEWALNQILGRHEILRTTILEVDGMPRQMIHPFQPLQLPVSDLSVLPQEAREAQLARIAAQEALRPFDLTRDLVMRPRLFRLGETDHVLALTAHRIAFDAWSAHILTQELTAFYEANVSGGPAPFADPPIQYGDFACWQRQWLQGEVLERLTAFWKKQLGGDLPLLRLPSGQPRPATQTHRVSSQKALISVPVRDALKALGGRENTTLYTVLLAAFCVLLSRYTGQDDILIGSPVAGRTRLETEDMIGLFLNTLILRADLSGAPTFRELLGRLRQVTVAAISHQGLPFEKLVEALKPERGLNRPPLFQVLFNLEDLPERAPVAGTLVIDEFEFETDVSQFDLSLEIINTPKGLSCSLRHSTDLFADPAARRLLGHYQTLLEGIVADPTVPISELPLITPAERHQLLVEWNDTGADYPKHLCVHQLIEDQAERAPEAVAAVAPRGQLTYGELNRKANQLARYLRKRGVGPGVLVGIFVERSLEMMIGLLGILKAGGAYIALDPRYPRARLAYMLKDSRVRLLLSEARVLTDLPGYDGEMLCLDRDHGLFAEEESANLEPVTKPEDLFYVIYTSGSTGVPKGVLIAHRGAVNYLTFLAKSYHLGPSDIVLQVASPSFDASVREIVGPLTAGARVVLVDSLEARDPGVLLSKIQEHGVTCLLSVVPTMLNALIAAAGGVTVDCSSVRLVMVSGESFYWDSLRKARAVFTGASVMVNHYGPAEITMIATHYPVSRSPDEAAGGMVPIGRPVPNAQIYILDPHLQPVPIGVPGELYVGGVGLARGYLNLPELTSERFIPNPFTGKPGDRLYRTGDLARYLDEGNVEFLGRLDYQVKVRGYRVELGEIEAVLGQHPSLRQAAVTAIDDAERGTRLIAHVVPARGGKAHPAILRSFLRERLPDFMIPSAFVIVDGMPLTPSGKIDRRALRAPEQARPELETKFVAPRTAVENGLAKIWCDLLGLDQVGVHDNFFDLGGHSLLATRIVSRVREALHVEVGLRWFFEGEPTLAGMAEHVEALGRIAPPGETAPGPSTWPCLVPIQPAGTRPPLFCIHWAGGHVVIFRDLARHLGPDQPVYGLQAQGLDGIQTPHTRIEDMAAHYIQEVRSLQPSGPYYLAGASMGGKIAFEMAQQLLTQGDQVALLALVDAAGDVERQPLPVGERIQLHSSNLQGLGWTGRVRYVWERLRIRLRRAIYGLLIRTGRPLPRFLKSLRAIAYVASRNYHPRTYPGKVMLFKASQRPVGGTGDFFLGWDRVAGGGMEVHEIPGDHISLLKEPGVRLLAEELSRCLVQDQGSR
jgi:amino acid adenylation domain-containing protein